MPGRFRRLTEQLDLTGVGTVTDIGGGSGALIGRILERAPHVNGVLFDRPATVIAAEPALRARHGVPGGDLLVLSRILHDWDDAACERILTRCREALRHGGRLAVVERLLGDRPGSAPLAAAWDVNMMVNNSTGRERTLDDYRRLLHAAGFSVSSRTRLPLEIHLLEAVAV